MDLHEFLEVVLVTVYVFVCEDYIVSFEEAHFETYYPALEVVIICQVLEGTIFLPWFIPVC